MDDYLGKPVTIGQLSQKLERWLRPQAPSRTDADLPE
jgi:hypothetical protein